jgi:hypothetical protein
LVLTRILCRATESYGVRHKIRVSCKQTYR